MPSRKSCVTLQGLKNKNSRAKYRRLYGGELVRIYSGEWKAWWRKNSSGYTYNKEEAGLYSLSEALDNSGHCGPEKKISYFFVNPVKYIKEIK